MLNIKGIRKSFGENEVLKELSFQIQKGDVTVILGPSGSGKTTLLRCIDFLEKADEGSICVGDSPEIHLTGRPKKRSGPSGNGSALFFRTTICSTIKRL